MALISEWYNYGTMGFLLDRHFQADSVRRDLRNRSTDSAGTTHRDVRALALTVLAAVSVVACDGGNGSQPEPPGGGGGSSPGAARVAWSQEAPSADAVQGYAFILFIDGLGTSLSGATCSGAPGPPSFDCYATLPPMSPGRRVLELSAIDQATGLESSRSGPVTVEVAGNGRPASEPSHVADEIHEPSVTCATGEPSTCFTITLIAADIGPVRRLLPLPDGRLLVLLADGAVTMLPSGTSERPALGRAEAGVTVEAVDVAADPAFHTNQFLYLATVASEPSGRRTVSVVRVRELADRVGEAATIVADLPAARAGDPAVSLGPDGHIYLAMPSGPPADRQPYDGHVLRFTRDGAAAGHARSGSPILARGNMRPASLAWDASSRLLMASGESGGGPALAVVPVDPGSGAWPATPIRVVGADADVLRAGVDGMAVGPRIGTHLEGVSLSILGANPETLYIATLAPGDPAEIRSRYPLPLGSLTPTTLAFATNGDLIVAARPGGDNSRVRLLRLHAE